MKNGVRGGGGVGCGGANITIPSGYDHKDHHFFEKCSIQDNNKSSSTPLYHIGHVLKVQYYIDEMSFQPYQNSKQILAKESN